MLDHGQRMPTNPSGYDIDVMKYGANGDGKIDDTKAFLSAWQTACGSSDGVTMMALEGKTFLLSPIQFQGPCKASSITFKILGALVAPHISKWSNTTKDEWIEFDGVNGLNVVGNGQGSINGQGESWWPWGKGDDNRPTAIRFSKCNNLQVKGLQHINSQKNHVSINGCNRANISGLVMTSPATSPNTDGINIIRSTYIYINNCTMKTGDDCISINSGSSKIFISEVSCGPGHGISVGSLGSNGQRGEVETISVDHCTFTSTTNGARIKTWQGGTGFARNINFTNLIFKETDTVVVVDQFYCPDKKCFNKASAVKISDVQFRGLRGTSICKKPTISIKCSNTVPCENILLDDVNIQASNTNALPTAECMNAKGKITRTNSPSVACK